MWKENKKDSVFPSALVKKKQTLAKKNVGSIQTQIYTRYRDVYHFYAQSWFKNKVDWTCVHQQSHRNHSLILELQRKISIKKNLCCVNTLNNNEHKFTCYYFSLYCKGNNTSELLKQCIFIFSLTAFLSSVSKPHTSCPGPRELRSTHSSFLNLKKNSLRICNMEDWLVLLKWSWESWRLWGSAHNP